MLPSDDMHCQELVELITDYLEQVLPAGERRRFEQHLAICPGCQAYLQQMQQTIGVSRQLSEDELDPQMRARLLAAFRTWKTG